MPEVMCSRIRIKPGSLGAVRDWARTISERRDEALATLREEDVHLESVFLEHASDGDYLVYYMRATDLAASREIGRTSKHAIDDYHHRFMKEHTELVAQLELLVDLDLAG